MFTCRIVTAATNALSILIHAVLICSANGHLCELWFNEFESIPAAKS